MICYICKQSIDGLGLVVWRTLPLGVQVPGHASCWAGVFGVPVVPIRRAGTLKAHAWSSDVDGEFTATGD